MGEEAERKQRPAALASAVGRHTAAVDVELSEPGSCFILTHTGLFTRRVSVCGYECLCTGRTLNLVWLSPDRTEALTVSDKRQAPSVKSTWHRASFSLADAKKHDWSAGRWADGCTHPLSSIPPSQLGRKSSDRPPLSGSHSSRWWWQSLCLHSLRYLNPSLSCLFTSLPFTLQSMSLTLSPYFSSPSRSQKVHFKRLYPWGAVKHRKARLRM